ncbi:MAG: response regulator FixJ [Pseudaminobacter sp.]
MQDDATIHVIDDDEGVRRSLAFLLRSAGIEAVAYASAIAFLDSVSAIRAGCVVTDVRMPDMNGIELLKCVRALDVALPVIVMTGHGDLSLAVEAMKAGAADFLEKPFDDETLLASVRLAMRPGGVDADQKADGLEYRRRIGTLTERERDVFESLIEGHSGKTIAKSLGISPSSVEIDRANVMIKMNATSLSKLVRMAMIAGSVGENP